MPSLRADAPGLAGLDPEVREIVLRCAAVHRGLALLHRAPVDSVAVTLGVHPLAVVRVRSALDSPTQRAIAISEFSRAVARSRRPPAEADRVRVTTR